jgi:mRNA interferase RelE/StbE
MSANEQPAFEVRLRSGRVRRELDGLQEADYQRVIARLRALADVPRPQGCEKLYDDIYRVRVGDIRIIYLVDEGNKRIEVGGIRRRSERTYRGIEGMFR